MPLVRRTVELIVALVVASVALALFLGFFFFWVIAPVSAIAAFYIVYLVVAFVLTHRLGWSLPEFVLMLVAGLVPGLIFWVEHRVVPSGQRHDAVV